jgi:hypothetical protein
MKMADQHNNLPQQHQERSILLFGSLSLSFNASSFAQVRRTVIEDDDNTWVVDTVRQLPQDLELVLSKLPVHQNSGTLARKQVAELQEAILEGRPLDIPFPLPNAVLIPLVVIDQLSQYAAFTRRRNAGSVGMSNSWAKSKINSSTMGLCTGVLSSFVVSSSNSWDEFQRYGAAAIRLGMLAGLVVDSQDAAFGGGRSRSLTVAWSREQELGELQRVLQEFDEVNAFPFTMLWTSGKTQI